MIFLRRDFFLCNNNNKKEREDIINTKDSITD